MLSTIKTSFTFIAILFATLNIGCDEPISNNTELTVAIENLSPEHVKMVNEFVVALSEEGEQNIPSGPEGFTQDVRPSATPSGWTGWTYDNHQPIQCSWGALISGFQCASSYCGMVKIYCSPFSEMTYYSNWTPMFSEEGTAEQICPGAQFMTGVHCNGSNCDSLSIQCSVTDSAPINCKWHLTWLSEENGGTILFPSGYYARGMRCNGSYCDKKMFWICQRQ